AGFEVAESRLVDLLCADLRSERFAVCRDLAWAFLSAGRSKRALQLARRAFGLWDGESGFIEKYIELLRAERDAEGIRVASKRAGMLSARMNDVMGALRYFNMHHYAYQSTGWGDRYDYDHDILKEVERFAGVRDGQMQVGPAVSRQRIRVAYLVFGANHVTSVLVRIMHDFARHHDRSQFEVLFFSPDTDNSFVRGSVGSLLSAGGELVIAASTDDWICIQRTKAELKKFAPDIVVSVAALADYRQYYLFAGCPAAVHVSLSYGPPAQFVPPAADWAISATRHPHMDNPCDSSVIQLETTLPMRPRDKPILPEGVRIPEGAVVIMAAGRSEKFLNQQYWEALLKTLDSHPDACMIVVGIIQRPEFLDGLLDTAAGRRIQILGWLENYHAILAHADIVVDTYPSGGGLTITDSMAFGIPVLSFANDYLAPYNQTDWNPAEEILGNPELTV
ncbi:MAG TPA: glycosyltransferase, partial [Bellilinea sp.]|nr:glycosyltransferase [Bellilinea sp.]